MEITKEMYTKLSEIKEKILGYTIEQDVKNLLIAFARELNSSQDGATSDERVKSMLCAYALADVLITIYNKNSEKK